MLPETVQINDVGASTASDYRDRYSKNYLDKETRQKIVDFALSLTSDSERPTEAQKAFVKECVDSDDALRRWAVFKLVWKQLWVNLKAG